LKDKNESLDFVDKMSEVYRYILKSPQYDLLISKAKATDFKNWLSG